MFHFFFKAFKGASGAVATYYRIVVGGDFRTTTDGDNRVYIP